jgi:type I restriction enzyme S subunit
MFKQSGIAVYEQQHAIYDNFESFRYFIDDNKYQEMKRFEVKANDLIMSCSGTYGKIAIIPEGSPKGIINQALLKITPDKGVRSEFIKHWMQSSLFQLELEKDIGGAALQNVPSVARMKSIKIRLPEEEIQIGTVLKLDEFQREIKQIEAIQEGIKNNYVALRNSLLSSEFTEVEVVA